MHPHYVNGYSNGHTNSYTNGHTNGYTNGYANGHTNGYVNGHTNDYANGYTNGYPTSVDSMPSDSHKHRSRWELVDRIRDSFSPARARSKSRGRETWRRPTNGIRDAVSPPRIPTEWRYQENGINGITNGYSRLGISGPAWPLSNGAARKAFLEDEQPTKEQPLRGWIALVTGASRGIGKGIALQLGQAGATVYVTGRPPERRSAFQKKLALPALEETANEITKRGGKGIAIFCDHSDTEDVKELFRIIDREHNGRLDILVNNAQSNVNEHIHSDRKFYEYPLELMEETNSVALTNHYVCSVLASRMMIPRGKGLIVTMSSGGGINFLFNTPYGVNKAAKERMAADMAHELFGRGIVSVALECGAVKTEAVEQTIINTKKAGLSDLFGAGETTEFAGMCIVALATDPDIMKKTGRILTTTQLAKDYDLHDIDGSQPTCPVYSRFGEFYDTLNDIRTQTALGQSMFDK